MSPIILPDEHFVFYYQIGLQDFSGGEGDALENPTAWDYYHHSPFINVSACACSVRHKPHTGYDATSL